jgi:hypothetical protein
MATHRALQVAGGLGALRVGDAPAWVGVAHGGAPSAKRRRRGRVRHRRRRRRRHGAKLQRETRTQRISATPSHDPIKESRGSLSLGACNTEFTEEYSLVFGLHRTVHQCQHGAARTPREGGQQACQPCSRRATHTHAHPRYRETLAHEERRDETREWSTGEGPRRETDSGMVVWSHTPLAKAFSVARKLVLERRIRLSASAGQGIKAVSYAWNGKSRVPFWCSKASRRDLPFQAYDRRPKWIGK